MHILFLSDNFPPEVNAPASRTFEHCREWVKAGHKVTVITSAPNFPKGRLLCGYRNRLWQSEDMAGIRVIRTWTYIAANQGFARRIADYVSYMVTATVASAFVRRVDIVIGTSPQFFAACAGYVVGGMKRIPFVFELRDLWPESIRAVGAMKQSVALDWMERLELFLYRKASLIISVTNSFRDNLARRGVNPDKIRIVTNGVDMSRFAPRPKDEELVAQYGLEGKFVAGYIGTHGMAHGLETIIEAAEEIRRRPSGEMFNFLLLGDGAEKQKLIERASGLENVLFLDSVPKEAVPQYWSLLDASIIHLKKDDLFRSVIPSKLFECMAQAIPVLHGVEGESAEIVLKEGVGIAFEPGNAQALCDALERVAREPGLRTRLAENGPRAALRYDRNNLARRMLAELEQTVAHRPSEKQTKPRPSHGRES